MIIQVERASKLPCVAPRIAIGRLEVHGWVYQFEQGQVVLRYR